MCQRVYDKIRKQPFFARKLDALRNPGVLPRERITAALRIMTYGTSSDIIEEYCRLSETYAMMSLKEFTRGVVEKFGLEYL